MEHHWLRSNKFYCIICGVTFCSINRSRLRNEPPRTRSYNNPRLCHDAEETPTEAPTETPTATSTETVPCRDLNITARTRAMIPDPVLQTDQTIYELGYGHIDVPLKIESTEVKDENLTSLSVQQAARFAAIVFLSLISSTRSFGNSYLHQLIRIAAILERVPIPAEVALQSGLLDALQSLIYRSNADSSDQVPASDLDDLYWTLYKRLKKLEDEIGSPTLTAHTSYMLGDDFNHLDVDDPKDRHWITVIEHCAGDHCRHLGGYSGARVTAGDLETCQTAQGFVYKHAYMHPEPTDLDFEREGKYYLTNVLNDVTDRECAGPVNGPAMMLHNADVMYETSPACFDSDTAVLFHPTCFELFSRVSRKQLSCLDVHGLMQWFLRGPGQGPGGQEIEDDVLARGADQWWHHEAGDEWCIANPVVISGWQDALQAAFLPPGQKIEPYADAFEDAQKLRMPSRSQNRDGFLKLPQEILAKILDQLDSSDIARLRAVSRAFSSLPQMLFQRFLNSECPWAYEALSTEPTFPWALVDVTTLRLKNWEQRKARQAWESQKSIQENRPRDEYQTWLRNNPRPEIHFDLPKGLDMLPSERINWYKLFCSAKKMQDTPGLRNRRRIWSGCEKICDRIRELRENGEIEGDAYGNH